MISVLILTKNEEINLPHCLESLRWCDDIVVLDSGSTDRTVEIAKQAGCRVIHRAFDNWSSHLNWAGTQIQFKYPWLYYSDADEIVPEDLRAEIHRIAGDPNQSCAAYRLRYKNYFMGRWIKHCGIYPVWVLRFYRPESVRWERLVNPTAVVEGDSGRLASHFHHFSFRKGISSWVEKHNQYSTNEAIESIRSLDHRSIPWKDIFQRRDPAARRVALKELSFRMPYRSSLRFLYMYILKLGFLDGIPGYHYCKLLSFYEYLISLKIHELRHSDSTGVRRDED
jgi:glycosyltransferase involved in cell wall biosynthesis